ncbi:hypothetical protein MKW92_043705, partial [Papaver armeniacum]
VAMIIQQGFGVEMDQDTTKDLVSTIVLWWVVCPVISQYHQLQDLSLLVCLEMKEPFLALELQCRYPYHPLTHLIKESSNNNLFQFLCLPRLLHFHRVHIHPFLPQVNLISNFLTICRLCNNSNIIHTSSKYLLYQSHSQICHRCSHHHLICHSPPSVAGSLPMPSMSNSPQLPPIPGQMGMQGSANQMVQPMPRGHMMGMHQMHSGYVPANAPQQPPHSVYASGMPNIQGPSGPSGPGQLYPPFAVHTTAYNLFKCQWFQHFIRTR